MLVVNPYNKDIVLLPKIVQKWVYLEKRIPIYTRVGDDYYFKKTQRLKIALKTGPLWIQLLTGKHLKEFD